MFSGVVTLLKELRAIEKRHFISTVELESPVLKDDEIVAEAPLNHFHLSR